MGELHTVGFRAHPALSHILNLHLQDNVMSRSKFEKLEPKFLEVEKIAREAKKEADKQESEVLARRWWKWRRRSGRGW